MILDLICSIGLVYFIARECHDAYEYFEASGSIIWAAIGSGLVGLLVLTLLAVWL